SRDNGSAKASMFKLLRYFSITSLLSIAIAAAVFGYCYRTFAYRSLTETGQANNATVARALANAVSTQLARYIATADSMSAGQLQSQPAKDEFSALLARNIQGLSIVKLKVIDPRGLTLYSTSPNQISDDESTNPGFMAANAGSMKSELAHRDRFSGFDRTIENADILSTFVPIRLAAQRAAPG